MAGKESGVYKPYDAVREPTNKEREELMGYYSEVVGYGPDAAYDVAFSSAICVFDGYHTDSPGYTGRLMIVVGGAEYIYEAFIWTSDGVLEHSDKMEQI